MKRTSVILSMCLCSLSALHAQEISLKYGKITKDELNMTVYSKDSTADAVVLYEDGKTYFDYNPSSGFGIITSYSTKVKILKQEGIDEASISIPFYSGQDRDYIEGFEAISYNMENGEIVKTKLDKKYIFEEELNKNFKQMKFSFPNVKVGTIIEYKYKKRRSSIYNMPDWEMQSHIPVMNSCYKVSIPEYFLYNVDTKGYEHIEVTQTKENQQFNVGGTGSGSLVTCTSTDRTFLAKDIPALKDEDYVWCLNDFRTGIRFEMSGTNLPGSFYKPFSQTWDDVDKSLSEDLDFTGNLKASNPYKDEIKALISNVSDKREKIDLIYKFIKDKIRWNGSYDFYGNSPKDCAKKGTGNNAQINIMLKSALEDAGIESFPVLLSLRNNGRLPLSRASVEKLNTFILGVETSDSTAVYLDGSAIYGGVNVLPSNLRVDRAYVFNPAYSKKWVNLTQLTKNEQRSSILAKLDNEGNLQGLITTTYTNQNAYSYKEHLSDAKDSTEYIQAFQNNHQLTVDSVTIKGKDPMSNSVKERLCFSKKIELAGDYIYINPMLFGHVTKNSFTQVDRKLPVEFDYPYAYTTNCNLMIPENYEVVEIPKSQRMELNDNQGSCTYQIAQQGNNIQLRYKFELNQTIFSFTDYTSLRDFYGQVATKNTEMIVLKKKQS